MRKGIVLLLMLASITAFAKGGPALTVEQKNTLLTAERDYLIAFNQAQVAQQRSATLFQTLQSQEAEILKTINADEKEWKFNLDTMSFEAVPPKTEPKKETK